MVRNISTYLLCVILASTSVFPAYAESTSISPQLNEQEIRQQYPDAKIIHISQEDYTALAENLRSQGYSEGIENNFTQINTQNTDTASPAERTITSDRDCNTGALEKHTRDDDSINTTVDITGDLIRSGGNGGGDSAPLVFVIIGTVLIVVWVFYVFKYLFDLASGFTPCETWYELTYSSSSISDTPDRYFDMQGLRFLTGFRDGYTDVGIAVEMGHADILLTEQQSLKLDGFYWLLGPTLRWRLSDDYNPHYIHMNFLGGSTEHDEIGVIAKATLGLQFGFGKHFHLGFNWGVMNINLHDNSAILTDRDQYHFLYGVNSGFRF